MKVTKKYFGPCQTALEYFSRGNFKNLIEDYNGAINDYLGSVLPEGKCAFSFNGTAKSRARLY